MSQEGRAHELAFVRTATCRTERTEQRQVRLAATVLLDARAAGNERTVRSRLFEDVISRWVTRRSGC